MGERVAEWFRVSTKAQSEQNQFPAVAAHCDARGYEVVKRFELHGDSAYKGAQEPELQQALADIEAGLYAKLVIFDSSRLDRRDPDIAEFYRLSVVMAGGAVESVTEPLFGKKGISGKVMTVVAQDQNHNYSRKLSAATRAGHRRIDDNAAARTRPPWGYRLTGEKYSKKLTPTVQGKKYVVEVFSRVAAGESCQAVADWLTGETGRRFYAKTVASMVRRTAYFGQHEWQHAEADDEGSLTGTTVTRVHSCPPLVSYGLWERAGARLDAPPHRGKGTDRPAMLKGIAVHTGCGQVMVKKNCRYLRQDGTRLDLWYYRCTRCASRPRLMVRLSLADRAVDALVRRLGTEPAVTWQRVRGTDWQAEARRVERQLRELPRQGLSWDEEDARRAELRAQWEDYSGREPEPDTEVAVKTGETWADQWDALATDAQRGAWLVSQGITVRLTGEGAAVLQDVPWTGDEPPGAMLPMLPKQADLAPGGGRVAHYLKFSNLAD